MESAKDTPKYFTPDMASARQAIERENTRWIGVSTCSRYFTPDPFSTLEKSLEKLQDFFKTNGAYPGDNTNYKDLFRAIGESFLIHIARALRFDEFRVGYDMADAASSEEYYLMGMRNGKGYYISFNANEQLADPAAPVIFCKTFDRAKSSTDKDAYWRVLVNFTDLCAIRGKSFIRGGCRMSIFDKTGTYTANKFLNQLCSLLKIDKNTK